MDGQATPRDDRPLRVQLELYLDREPVSGRLEPERGPAHRFVGWLGFVEALRRLSDAQTEERS